jgi:uncharacterized membrane protein
MSNKKISGLFIILAVFFVFFLQSAMALSEDFSVAVQKNEIGACSCGLTADSYTIRNTGSVTSTYEITKSGTGAQYSTLSESFFSLEPGQSKDIINYFNLPCGILGSYNEIINVKTIFGLSKSFEQKINVGRCANFEIIPLQSMQSACPCSPVKYDINIKNTGSYDEVFDLNISAYAEYAALGENSVVVRPNENKTVAVYFNLPCAIHGEKDLSIGITAERSKYLANVPLKLDIRDCYDYSLNSNSQFTLCEGELASTPVEIRNNAEFSNEYVLGTNAGFAKIFNNSISLAPNQTGYVNLEVDGSKVYAGNYSFKITSNAARGELQKEIACSLNVERCRDFMLKIIAPKTSLIASKSYDYEIEIDNLGTRPGNFNINVEGPEWLVLEKNRTSLAAGQNGKVLLRANIPADFEGSAYARIIVNEDWISDSKKITISPISVDSAYLAEIKPLTNAVKYDLSDINVSIENKGVEPATYRLSLEGPEWMRLSQNAVTLAPGENAVVPIQTSPTNETPEGRYQATVIASVAEAGIGYSSTFNVKLFTMPWHQKLYYLIAPFFIAYWLYIVIVLAAIVVLVILIILLKKLAKRMKESRQKRKEMEAQAVKIVEEPAVAKYQPSFQPFATPTIIPESVPKMEIPEIREKREINWRRFFSILFLIIVVAGVISLAVLNWPAIAGFFAGMANQTQQPAETPKTDLFAPELTINRSTGIEGEGNVVYIREDGLLDIPVTIKNNAPAKVIYTIKNDNSSWIRTDKGILSLDINGSDTLHLLVNTTPDLPDGTYEISLGLNINEQDLKYSEKIALKIQREKPLWVKYLPYLIAGVALAILLVIILALTRKSGFDVKKERPKIEVFRTRERGNFWRILGKIILIIVIIAVVAGAVYYVSHLPEEEEQQYEGSLDLGSQENQTIGIKLGMNDRVIIPFIFSNGFDKTARYEIDSSADWIEATDDKFRLDPGETNYVNITAFPGKNAAEGMYNSTIMVYVDSENIRYEKTIVFQLKDRSLGKTLMENKFFVIGIAIVIVGLLLLLVFKKRKEEKRQFLAEIKQEIEMEKQKRVVAAPKTKIKVPRKRK